MICCAIKITRLAKKPDIQPEKKGGGEWITETVPKVKQILESSEKNLKIMINMLCKLVENTENFTRKLISIKRSNALPMK